MARNNPNAILERTGRRLETGPAPELEGEPDAAGAAQAVILAGGDGIRLRPLTFELVGDDRPKQFVALFGNESLLAQTRRRAALVVPPERTQIVLTRAHEPYYRNIVADALDGTLATQPQNRGTATAVLYALFRMARQAGNSPVIVLPSDHWISNDAAFMAHVATAVRAVEAHPDLIVLLGILPTRPEPGYGWIESAEPLFGPGWDLRRVRSFIEKPARELASVLQARGLLWNSLVIIGRVASLLLLFATALPSVVNAFVAVWPALGSSLEKAAVERLYRQLPATDLSSHVLATHPEMLAVLPVLDVSWDDLGDPTRALAVRRRAVGRPLADGSSRRAPEVP